MREGPVPKSRSLGGEKQRDRVVVSLYFTKYQSLISDGVVLKSMKNVKTGQSSDVFGLFWGPMLLIGGILVLIAVPTGGGLIKGYPKLGVRQQVPHRAPTTVQAIIGIDFVPWSGRVVGYVFRAGTYSAVC